MTAKGLRCGHVGIEGGKERIVSLLSQWRKWDPENFPYALDMDADVLTSPSWKPWVAKYRGWRKATGDPDFCKSGDKRLHLGLIPVPFMGDMRKASVYILMLNPGLGPGDYFECRVPSLRQALLANLRQEHMTGVTPFVYLDPQFAWHGGFAYWHQKLKRVIEELAESRCMSLADARATLGSKLAVVQLVPYHSTVSNPKALKQLSSVRLAQDFVRQTVAKRVRARDAIVIVTRQVKTWDQCLPDDLGEEHGVIRYTPSESRGASLGPKSRGGRAILRKLGVSTDSCCKFNMKTRLLVPTSD